MKFSLEMAFVRVIARKMLNFPPEVGFGGR